MSCGLSLDCASTHLISLPINWNLEPLCTLPVTRAQMPSVASSACSPSLPGPGCRLPLPELIRGHIPCPTILCLLTVYCGRSLGQQQHPMNSLDTGWL